MTHVISSKRWEKAQQLELKDWKYQDIIKNETKEIEVKYLKVLTQIAKKISYSANWKILDVGCGPTCISRFLPKADKYGIDPLAKKLGISNQTISGVKIKNGKGERIPFKEKSFDFVICRNSIDHSQSPDKIIKEIKRVLKPKGYLVLCCYVYTPFIVSLKKISESLGIFRNLEHPFAFTEKDLRKSVKKDFILFEEITIFEGKHSTDFGKQGTIKPDKSLVNRFVIFINNKVLKNNWFVREHLILAQSR